MNRVVWIFLSISVIYYMIALGFVKNPIGRRNYLLVASIFLLVCIGIAIFNQLR
jgi:hypothetical protein